MKMHRLLKIVFTLGTLLAFAMTVYGGVAQTG